MSPTLNLAALPLIAFSACSNNDELQILQADGGMLDLFDTADAPASWLGKAIHPEERTAFLTPPQGESRQLVRLQTKDGAWRWFNLRISDVQKSGDALCYTALLTDATEFKAMEEVAQRYRDYTEITSDWYWEMDEAHRFTYFSREFEEVTGLPSANALGKTRWDGLGREHLGNIDWEAHKQSMYAHKPIRNFEYPSRRTDGRIVWLRASGSPRYDDSGKFIGYYGIAADISATRRIEERLQQSERLASIGQLAAGVAHEINNPISFVRSNVEMLGNYLDSLLKLLEHYAAIEASCAATEALSALQIEKKKADLDYLREDAPVLLDECRNGLERVRKIVADLREFSREGDTDWSETDIHTCLESAINLIAGGLPKTVEIKRQYAALPALRCKPLQLNQVFLALLSNAAQAIGEQPGCITVSSGKSDNGEAWVEVADTGCGIAAENLPRIFEPFFTTRPIGKGTGMGLSMSFGIVADHGGRIEAQSTAGSGSTFRVSLPDNPEQAA
jgi:PAS domain S-box-containing protein